MAGNLSCFAESDGLLKVKGSRVQCKTGIISTMPDSDCVTTCSALQLYAVVHAQESSTTLKFVRALLRRRPQTVIYGLTNSSNSDDLEGRSHIASIFKRDFSYRFATVDETSADIACHAVPLRQLSLLCDAVIITSTALHLEQRIGYRYESVIAN